MQRALVTSRPYEAENAQKRVMCVGLSTQHCGFVV